MKIATAQTTCSEVPYNKENLTPKIAEILKNLACHNVWLQKLNTIKQEDVQRTQSNQQNKPTFEKILRQRLETDRAIRQDLHKRNEGFTEQAYETRLPLQLIRIDVAKVNTEMDLAIYQAQATLQQFKLLSLENFKKQVESTLYPKPQPNQLKDFTIR